MGTFYSKISSRPAEPLLKRVEARFFDESQITSQILLNVFSLNECKNLCEKDEEKLPSVFDFDMISSRFESHQSLYSRDFDDFIRRWTDGKLDYDKEEWTDSLGKSIPDHFWENFTLYRKACSRVSFPCTNWAIKFMGHKLWHKQPI